MYPTTHAVRAYIQSTVQRAHDGLPHGVLPSLVSDIRGIGIGVSHHHITGASPEDDIQAEGSQDPFLQIYSVEKFPRLLWSRYFARLRSDRGNFAQVQLLTIFARALRA